MGFNERLLVLLGVIIVEALIFWRMLPTSLIKALLLSIALNIASAIFGVGMEILIYVMPFLFFTFPIGILLYLAVLVLVIILANAFSRQRKLPVWVIATFFVCAFLGFIPAFSYGTMGILGIIDLYIGIALVIISAFGITLFAESVIITGIMQGKNLLKAVLVANIVSYLLLAGFAFYYAPQEKWYITEPGGRYPAWQSRAKGTLRSIGSAQLAYQSANSQKLYGSFQALQDVEDIAPGYSLANMIEDYSMSWRVSNISTAPTEEFSYGIISTFTIIAYPRDTREGFLHAFAITEDQVLRVYDPSSGASLIAVRTWDPIL